MGSSGFGQQAVMEGAVNAAGAEVSDLAPNGVQNTSLPGTGAPASAAPPATDASSNGASSQPAAPPTGTVDAGATAQPWDTDENPYRKQVLEHEERERIRADEGRKAAEAMRTASFVQSLDNRVKSLGEYDDELPRQVQGLLGEVAQEVHRQQQVLIDEAKAEADWNGRGFGALVNAVEQIANEDQVKAIKQTAARLASLNSPEEMREHRQYVDVSLPQRYQDAQTEIARLKSQIAGQTASDIANARINGGVDGVGGGGGQPPLTIQQPQGATTPEDDFGTWFDSVRTVRQ